MAPARGGPPARRSRSADADPPVSVRYANLVPFRTFEAKCQRPPELHTSSDKVLSSLSESIVERAADVLEMVAADLNEVSVRLFFDDDQHPRRSRTPPRGTRWHPSTASANSSTFSIAPGRDRVAVAVETEPPDPYRSGVLGKDFHFDCSCDPVARLGHR